MNPDDWLSQYDAKLQQVREQTDRAKEQLGQLGGTATSSDGQVTVKVNSSGALENIEFGKGFQHPQPERLASSIMECAQRAQRDAAGQMMQVMQDSVGEGEALDFVRSNLPHGYAGDGTDEDESAPSGSQHRRGTDHEDDDVDEPGQGGFLR